MFDFFTAPMMMHAAPANSITNIIGVKPPPPTKALMNNGHNTMMIPK
jgi:hypothetical protein